MSVCSLEFSFPRSFLVKIYQKRFSAPFVEYAASYLNANFDLKRCAVRTINDDRLAKQVQLSYDLLPQSTSSSEGKIVVELRKLAVDVSKSAIRISLFDIIDQPFRADLSDTDNESITTIDRINFTLPHSYVLKSVKNTAGSSFHLEAWYLGQGGVVLPCMLNTTCECLDDGGGEQLTLVFDGLILNTQVRPLTMKFLSASINSQGCKSDKALKPSQNPTTAKIPSGSETVTPLKEHTVDSLLTSEAGPAQEGDSQVASTLYPVITSNMTPGDEAAPIHFPVLQVSACPNAATECSKQRPKESDPACDPSYSSLVHIEEIIANDFSTSKTNDTDSESIGKTDMLQDKPGSLNQISGTISESVEENISGSMSELQKNGETSGQKTNDTGLQKGKDSGPVIDVDASCSAEKASDKERDKGENEDCLAKGHTMELVDPESGSMTIMRVSDDEEEEEVEIVGVEDNDKSKDDQKSNKTPKKTLEDNSDIHKIVASIVESLHADNAQKESSTVSAPFDLVINMDACLKAPSEFQSPLNNSVGQPPVGMDTIPSIMGTVFDPRAAQGQACLPLDANSKQDNNKGKNNQGGEFDPEWADQFPWVMYDKNQHIMFCQVCISAKKSNIFTAGSHFFTRGPLITHTKSLQHIDAVRLVQETVSDGQSLQWRMMVDRCQEQVNTAIGLRNVFDYTWLIDFPWLKYDEVDSKIFCKLCQKHKRNTLYGKGVTLFNRRRIREHQRHKCHIDAFQLESALMENNGDINSKTVMRLDANSELIFSMETLDTEKEPLHWNRIAPPEEDNKTQQKENDMDVLSIKSEDSFQSPKLVAAGPYKVSPALSPVVMLTDVSKSSPDTSINESRRTLFSRNSSSPSKGNRNTSKADNPQTKDVSKKHDTAGDSVTEGRLSTRRSRRKGGAPCSPASSVDVDADINTLLPLVLDNGETVPKSVAKRLSFDNQSDVGLDNGVSSTDPSSQKRRFAVNGEKESLKDPDSILVNYLSCPAENRKKKWPENLDASVWKPVVVLDDISEDLSILNAHSFRTRVHSGQTKEKTVGKSEKALKRSVSTDIESLASKKSRCEDNDVDDDDTPLNVRLEACKSDKSKTRTSDHGDDVCNSETGGFNEIKSSTGKKLRNAAECSVEVSLKSQETEKCRSSRKKSTKSTWSDTELTEPSQVTFDNNYDMMEILDGLDLTDMMMCHVVLQRIAV